MAHCEFTPELKLECVRDIILLLRQGPGRDEMLEIVEHAACFMGSGARMLRDSGPSPIVGSADKTAYDAAADELAAALPEGNDEQLLQGIPWVTIMKILLPIIIDLLTEESNA